MNLSKTTNAQSNEKFDVLIKKKKSLSPSGKNKADALIEFVRVSAEWGPTLEQKRQLFPFPMAMIIFFSF